MRAEGARQLDHATLEAMRERARQVIMGPLPMWRDLGDVIRGGTIIDGTGKAPFTGDVAIFDGRIAGVGGKQGPTRLEIDARRPTGQKIWKALSSEALCRRWSAPNTPTPSAPVTS
jgi:hypothetical protein